MGKHRNLQQLVDSATRLVIEYNKVVLLDYDAPSVGLTIYKGDTIIYVDDGEHKYVYGGPKPAEGRALKQGLAHVKQLLHEYQEKEAETHAQ